MGISFALTKLNLPNSARTYAPSMEISLSRVADVAVITWRDGENRLIVDSLGRLNEILDELATIEGPLAVVVTGEGKFFSNGLDLDRIGSNPSEFAATVREMERTIGRLLVFPAYTVAALNGHTFAGGALVSCAFDYRIMRDDRGFWCMNEVDIGLPLDEYLWSILEHRLPHATAVDAMLTARRYGAAEAIVAGIVQESASETNLLARAVEVAQAMTTKDRTVVASHKRLVHGAAASYLGFNS